MESLLKRTFAKFPLINLISSPCNPSLLQKINFSAIYNYNHSQLLPITPNYLPGRN